MRVRASISAKAKFNIGRAPSSTLALLEPEVAWRHCQIRRQGERYLISDLRSSAGTFINGMRSAERWLEDRDQISVGRTTLMFRCGAEKPAAMENLASSDTKPALLTACSLGVPIASACRPLMMKRRGRVVQNQILRLVSDLLPVAESHILLGSRLNVLEGELDKRTTQRQDEFRTGLKRDLRRRRICQFRKRRSGECRSICTASWAERCC